MTLSSSEIKAGKTDEQASSQFLRYVVWVAKQVKPRILRVA